MLATSDWDKVSPRWHSLDIFYLHTLNSNSREFSILSLFGFCTTATDMEAGAAGGDACRLQLPHDDVYDMALDEDGLEIGCGE